MRPHRTSAECTDWVTLVRFAGAAGHRGPAVALASSVLPFQAGAPAATFRMAGTIARP
jgi:hypothetical protein